MADQDPSRDYELVDQLVEEFAQRYAQGERPSVQEYCERYPDVADLLRDLLPAMAQIEQVKEGVAAAEEKPAAPPLRHLGDFHILREIGHGGMGVVYEAEQVSLGRRVALKVLTPGLLREGKQKRRFEREARAAARLHHTNIVPVFGTGEHEGTPYYVMQFIQGLGLDEVIVELKRMGAGAPTAALPVPTGRPDRTAAAVARSLVTGEFQPLTGDAADLAVTASAVPAAAPEAVAVAPRSADPSGNSSGVTLPGQSETSGGRRARKLSYWQSIARVGIQVADALEYAHKQGVVHRDIKPSNLLLDLKGTVWVTDFGLAKAEGAENLTHTGDVLGTLRYMPPEAFDGRADVRGDVYSLGLTLYELVGLRPAFHEHERNRLIKQVTTQEPIPLGKVRPGVPRDLETIIHKAIDRDPVRRYQTAGDMQADLQRFLDDEPILARRQTARERAWRWCRHHPAVALLLALLAVGMTAVTIASLLAAGHFNRLRWQEAQAKEEAEQAQERERHQREQADDSRQKAQAALKKAEENYARARAAVNDYLTAIGEDPRLQDPGFQGLRAQLLQAALGFYQEFLREGANDPTLRRELAHVYYRVGEIYGNLGQSVASGQSYGQAQRLYEALAAEQPGNPEFQDGVARCRHHFRKFEQAIALWEPLVHAEDPRYQAELGSAYNELAVVASRGGPAEKKKTLDLHLKALAYRERMARLRPDDPEVLRDLAGTVNNIANLLDGQQRPSEGLAVYRRAERLAGKAYALRPTDLQTSRFYAIILHNVATRQQTLGQTDAALASYRRRIQVVERRVRDHPDLQAPVLDLVRNCRELLEYLRTLDRPDEAARTARQYRELLADLSPADVTGWRELALFHLNACLIHRARKSADASAEAEQDAAAAVRALRNAALAGWRDADYLRDDPTTEPVRDRADFKDLLTQTERLAQIEEPVKKAGATAEERLAFRRAHRQYIEGLVGTEAPSRLARRSLAQARQDLGQAFLDLGRMDEARAAFDQALALRRQLVDEAPRDERLRADLAQSQTAAGDLLASAGRLADAAAVWDKELALLEDALRANPVSFPVRTALANALLHVADQYGRVGLWDRAAASYRRAFAVQNQTNYGVWLRYAAVLAETGDAAALRALTDRAASRLAAAQDVSLARIVLLAPDGAQRYRAALARVAEHATYDERHWGAWCRGLAAVRLGEAEKGRALLEEVLGPVHRGLALAFAWHERGQGQKAREALDQANRGAERNLRGALATGRVAVPTAAWVDWPSAEILRREAHQAIFGQPLPDSAYDRLHRGRLLVALGKPEQAIAEFDAAVALRPDDPEVWLTRARLFASLGRDRALAPDLARRFTERAVADLARAREQPAADAPGWIALGRLLAEQGQQAAAESAFSQGAVLAKGELNRFLEAGWWVVGPYPDTLDQAGPPERDADPSKPVAAVGRNVPLRWTAVATTPHTGSIDFHPVAGQTKGGAVYALAEVYAPRARTATVLLQAQEDARLWVNGRLAFDGLAAWQLPPSSAVSVPLSLKSGRNTLLLKVASRSGSVACRCRFTDSPFQKAIRRAELGLWADAANAFAEADRRSPLAEWETMFRLRCLLCAGREREYRHVFAEMVRRFDRPGSPNAEELIHACYLPPERSPQRDRWVTGFEKRLEKKPNDAWTEYFLGKALYRAARFEEAEKHLRRSQELEELVYKAPLLAATCQRLGKQDEARQILRRTEERFADLVQKELRARPYRVDWSWDGRADLLILLREARSLINGRDPGLDANEPALQARGREQLTRLERAGDDFARVLESQPHDPRLWLARGQWLFEQKRDTDAEAAFDRAVELAPRSAQVYKERGRIYAEAGRWDQAAADFVRALELASAPTVAFPAYPWRTGRGGIDDLVARWDAVFDRVTKRRPDDSALWARRVEFFAAAGRWREAEATLRELIHRFPDDGWAPNLLATLLLYRGDLKGYEQVCRDALQRFAGRASAACAVSLCRTASLAPAGLHELPSFQTLLKAVTDDSASTEEVWPDLVQALVNYRRGDAAAALRGLAEDVDPIAGNRSTGAVTNVVRALAYQSAGQPTAARDALARARGILLEYRPRPERGWLHDGDWPNWLGVEILVREAGRSIPDVSPAVATTPSPVQDAAARQARQDRAERAATAFALALIRLDLGERQEAETGLRQVLADRTRLVAEEPGNPMYRSQLATTDQALGKLFTDADRLDEADRLLNEALTIRQRLAADAPKDLRARAELAGAHDVVGDLLWKTGHQAGAVAAWQTELDLLESALKEDPKNTGLGAALARAEQAVADLYGSEMLWSEASRLYARSLHRPGADNRPWPWLRAAQLALAAGDLDQVRKLGDEALARFDVPADPVNVSAMTELLALVPCSREIADRFLPVAEKNVRDRPDVDYLPGLAGIWAYRAGHYEDAVRRLDTPRTRNHPWAKAFLAMAHHRLGHAAEARKWLARSADEYTRNLYDRVERPARALGTFWVGAVNEWAYYREAHQLITGQPVFPDPQERLYRARAYHRLGQPDRAEAEFRAAVESRPTDPAVWLARSRTYARIGCVWHAVADLHRAHQLAVKALTDRPTSVAAGQLADVLLATEPAAWTIARPIAVRSEAGVTLTVQPDGSVLASGVSPNRDVYTVELRVDGPVTALRLELLPDSRLPANGPGRAAHGNGHLIDFRATAIPVTQPGSETAVTWARAFADFNQGGLTIQNAIDGNPDTAWGIVPRTGQRHWAVFVPERPLPGPGPYRLTVRLETGDPRYVQHTLGRFRLAVTHAAPAQLALLEVPADPLRAGWARLGAVRWGRGDRAGAAEAFARAAEGIATGDQVRQLEDLASRVGMPFEDLIRARPTDVRLWIAHGRARAEAGDRKAADAAFTQAARRARNEPNRFVEAGWWAIGPFPEKRPNTPAVEADPDPSRPVGSARWRHVPTGARGRVDLGALPGTPAAGTAWAFTYVYSTDERPALLDLGGEDRVRLWVNGRRVHESAWSLGWLWGPDRVPITLRPGRNTLLIEVTRAGAGPYFTVRLAPTAARPETFRGR